MYSPIKTICFSISVACIMDTGPAVDIAKTAYNALFNKLGRI